MTKREFLTSLSNLLGGIPQEEKNDILYDYEEHFRMGMAEGKTEEEIAQALGDVRSIAKQFKASYTIKTAEVNTSASNIFKAVLATMGLGFFNLVFVLGPFMGLVGVLIGLFAAATGMTVAGAAVLLAIILSPIFEGAINIGVSIPFALFISVGVTSLGLLFLIGDYYIAKFFFKGTLKYLKWNIDIIRR